MHVKTHEVRSARQALHVGVSAVALAAACIATPAWAQTEVSGSVNTGQEAADENEIVVTGRRQALEAAEERKRRSETIIDSIVADDAGKLPDNSIIEVLQRVSGVTIVRFAALGDPDHYSVEGAGIQVRGLTGVASRLNGRDIFSANNGRSLQFADVTPELMAAVDVYKASTADLIEGGTGGQIDLRTKVPFDFSRGFHFAANGELSHGDLARKRDLSGSVLASARFNTPIGEIGILGDIAYSRLRSNSHFFRAEPYIQTRIGAEDYYIPAGYTYGEEQFQRDRTGYYGAVQWAPSDDFTLTGTFFQSQYKNRSGDWGAFVASKSLAVDPASSEFDENNVLISSSSFFARDPATFLPAGPINSEGNKGAYRSKTTTSDYSLSFDWSPDDSPLAVKGAIQRVDSAQIYNRLDVFRAVPFPAGFGLDLSGDLPMVSVPAGSQATFDNPANYIWLASMPHDEDNKGRLDSANLDLEYRFDDGFFRSIKVGGRYAERSERDFNNGYNWAALGRGWNGDPQLTFANAAPGDVETHVFNKFFHGQAVLPANLMFPTDELVRRFDRAQLHAAPPAGFCAGREFDCSASGPLAQTAYGGLSGIRPIGFVLPDDRVDNLTTTTAGYALARFGRPETGGISGNVGVRVVHIENEGTGFIRQNQTQFVRGGQLVTLAAQAVPRSGEAAFTRVLPSINFDYSPVEDVKLRASYNITLDLPTFNALRASGSVGVATTSDPNNPGGPGLFSNFTAETGNPFLKPTMSNNFDLSFEYYLKPGTSFHFAPFYKRLTNLPTFSVVEQPVTVVYADGTTEDVVASANNYFNATEAATVKGFEIGGRVFLDMLPGWLAGFGFEGNYTFIDSSNPGDTYRTIVGEIRNDAPLVGLSKHNFNATALYERGPISARVAYSWRSKYLQTTNGNGTTTTYDYYSAPGVLTDLDGGAATSTQIALPVYGANYGQLEAGLRYKINENVSVGIQGTNITNATQRTLQGGYPGRKLYGRSWFQTDRRFSTSISVAF